MIDDRIAKAIEALEAYRSAQRKMLEKWAEGSYDLKAGLWASLHACEEKATEALEALRQPAPLQIVGGKHSNQETIRCMSEVFARLAQALGTPVGDVEAIMDKVEGLLAARQPSPTMMAHAHTKEQLTSFAEQHVAPAMMPDAETTAAMDHAWRNVVNPDGALKCTTSMQRWQAALSCDAFRNWMGGVGEMTLPELPEGWFLYELSQISPTGEPDYHCMITDRHDTVSATSDTPRQAVLAALANIKTEG